MIKEGDIVLFNFPQTDLGKGKLRPALILRKLTGERNDWLLCMITSLKPERERELVDKITEEDEDFRSSGLKTDSLIRIDRLAVVNKSILLGKIGEISEKRLEKIKEKLCRWIKP